jgi:secernin
MACEMATALPGTTSDGSTLFAHNSSRPVGEGQALLWVPGRDFAAGESVQVQHLRLPQVRRTHALIGIQPADAWGCVSGVNDQGVAMGATPTRTRLRGEAAGLTGADLVRLTLERSCDARQAVDAAADLIVRHGQGRYPGCPQEDDHDNAFLIADGREAYLLAACGSHWAVQQVAGVRALNEVCHLRKDWDRISPGLSGLAIRRGWWPEDGSKLDFAGALAESGDAAPFGYRWWGLATLLLEQHSGAVNAALMRRLLADPTPPRPRLGGEEEEEEGPSSASAGLVVRVDAAADAVPTAWCSFGPAHCGLYFPLPVAAGPPPGFRRLGPDDAGCDLWRRATGEWLDRAPPTEARAALADLQARFDQRAGEFAPEAAALKRHSDCEGLRRLTESFTQSNWECFEDVWEGLLGKEAAWDTACRMDAL